MTITSSIITGDAPQADGRRRVEECHTDQLGIVRTTTYLCEAGFDVATALANRAVQLNAQLKEDELRGMCADYPWNHLQTESTVAELFVYARSIYRSSRRDDLVPIASRILEWIANGRFTDAQVRNAFNLTSPQWTTLKNKMTALVSASTTIKTAAGE